MARETLWVLVRFDGTVYGIYDSESVAISVFDEIAGLRFPQSAEPLRLRGLERKYSWD